MEKDETKSTQAFDMVVQDLTAQSDQAKQDPAENQVLAGSSIAGVAGAEAGPSGLQALGPPPAAQSTEQGFEFAVNIDNPKRQALGLEVDSADPAKLFVVGVTQGSVMDRYNEEHAENKVEAVCFIVSVTGADAGSGGSQAMVKTLARNPEQVELVCRRARRFAVVVMLHGKGDIGVGLPKRPKGNSLLVTEVKANGAVERWNTKSRRCCPTNIVAPWDRIVAVGGVFG